MKKFAIAGIAALAIAGSTAVYAQHRHWFHEPHADEPGGPRGVCRRADRRGPCRTEAQRRPGKAVAAGREPRCGNSPNCGSTAPMRG